jgi:hypothetical protein
MAKITATLVTLVLARENNPTRRNQELIQRSLSDMTTMDRWKNSATYVRLYTFFMHSEIPSGLLGKSEVKFGRTFFI